ncbi:MAG TPA: two-component regulator propeller domain-containing protein [Pyrinomonadaceae bacterium]|nr:two-component regulator propeller domain-containing protein [Pyrinomonadaceae bacterium]
MRRSLITLLALTSLASFFAWEPKVLAQSAPITYLADSWTTEKGLPQNDVTQLIQTRDGYIWLGTNGGLVRFDGLQFTIFDSGNTPELRSNRILALAEDRDGTLWIGTQNGGLTSYSAGKFKNYSTKDGLPDESVFSIEADRSGNLWLSPGGLLRLTNGNFTLYSTREGLPSNGSGNIRAAPDGSIWFRSGDFIMHFHDGRFERFSTKDLPTDWIVKVVTMAVAGDGSLWLVTEYGLVHLQNGSFTLFNTHTAVPDATVMPSEFVITTFEDRSGSLRFLTPSGLAHYQDGKVIVDTRIPFHELSGLKMALWIVRPVIEDREGNLWVGSGGSGLYRFRARQITAYTAATGLSDEGFIPITDDGAGGLWLGSTNLINSLYHFQDGKFTPYDIGNQARSLCRDHSGTLWIGTNKGLYRLQSGQLIKAHPVNSLMNQGTVVQAIYEDRRANLWVGTGRDEAQDGALYRISGGGITKFQVREGLVSNDVRYIMEDHQGAIWVGTTRGMSRFKDERFTNYTTEQGLSSNFVREIHEDVDGILWIGTYGGGLNRFKDGRFIAITTKNGLFDNIVSRILEDDHGNFWMSGNRGIYRTGRRELNDFADGRVSSITSISYGVEDGMKINETNGGSQPAGWKTPDGKLWFPTIRGVVAIDPDMLNPLPPPVHIEQVLISQRPVDWRQPLEIQPGQDDLEIHYAGLSFTAPQKVRFRYKLDGYDKDWVEAKERRVAYYTQVAPGTYTFRVKAANNDGVWSTQDATIQLTVIPPFWRTWWFSFFVVLGLASVILSLYRRRIRQLQRARRTQEDFSKQLIASQESERKRIAGELHDSLSQNLVVIKNRAWLSLQEPNNHDNVLEQMEEIADAADQSLGEVREIAYNLRPFQIDRLGLTSAIESLTAKVDSPDQRFAAELENIDKLLLPEMEINLYRIVQEGINNIIKHSAATKAVIRIRRSRSLIEVSMEDNGRGFDTNAARSDKPGSGSGFGLIGIAERARILGSVPVIQSAVGQGTRIEIKLPYKPTN